MESKRKVGVAMVRPLNPAFVHIEVFRFYLGSKEKVPQGLKRGWVALNDYHGCKMETNSREQHAWRLGEEFRGCHVNTEVMVAQPEKKEKRIPELISTRRG